MQLEKKYRILIVEDDQMMSFLLEKHLSSVDQSLQPIKCSHGREALDYLQSQQQKDTKFLVLLDLNMPVMTGWEFLKKLEISAFAERVLVVIISSSLLRMDRTEAFANKRVIAFCTKPITEETAKRILELEELRMDQLETFQTK